MWLSFWLKQKAAHTKFPEFKLIKKNMKFNIAFCSLIQKNNIAFFF